MPRLVLSLDGVVLKEVPVAKDRTTIGRRSHNDLVIDNLAVSGEHAVLFKTGDDMYLEDLGSTNGTTVNGQPIKKHLLLGGDLIEIGKYRLKYIAEGGEPTAGGDVEPEVNEIALRIGDVLMLCSDGLTEMVDDVQIAGAIFASVPDVQRAAQRLVDMANAAGGRDNVSVIVVRLAGRKGLEPRRASAAESRPSAAVPVSSPSG